MNILITGGTGFQGSHLIEALITDGHTVRVLNSPSSESHKNLTEVACRSDIDLVWGSVQERNLVFTTIQDIDLVIHLAAEINVDKSLLDPTLFIETNVIGTLNVLDAVRKAGIRMIHASTCEVYGGAEYKPMDENHPLNPRSPYAASKTGGDHLCYAYAKSFGVNVTIVRPFNIYGPRQKTGKFGAVIPIFADKILSGEAPTIFGTGKQTRDYLFISDLVDAYMLMVETPTEPGEVINFGSGVETSIGYLASALCYRIDPDITLKFEKARAGEVSSFCAGIDKAKDLGWSPKVGIDKGLNLYLEWLTASR